MSDFDRFCAGTALLLGAVLLVFGAFVAIRWSMLLGMYPALVGWGIIQAVRVSWNAPLPEEPPVPVDEAAFSLTAPTLLAELVEVDGCTRLRVWCDHCDEDHYHGPAPGHREAHCKDAASPYHATGYNLAVD